MEKVGEAPQAGRPSLGEKALTHRITAVFSEVEGELIRRFAESRKEKVGGVVRRLAIGELVLPGE